MGAVLVGCGGRTSALDSDVYGSSDDGIGNEGGSSRGGSASGAGRPSTSGAPGTAGTLPIAGSGAAPSGGSSSIDPSLAVGPCNAYCPGYGTQCAERLMGQDCIAACQAEVNSFGPRCQSLGISALRCLTPFFTPNGADCDAAVGRALTACGKVVDEFQRCKGVPTNPGMPTPMPSPLSGCSGMGSSDGASCFDMYSCSTGSYFVTCSFSPSSPTADCFCLMPNGGANMGTFRNDGYACGQAATKLCQ